MDHPEREKLLGATILGAPIYLWVLPPGTPPGSQSEKPRKTPVLWRGERESNHREIHLEHFPQSRPTLQGKDLARAFAHLGEGITQVQPLYPSCLTGVGKLRNICEGLSPETQAP